MSDMSQLQRDHAFIDHCLSIHENKELLKKPKAVLVGLITKEKSKELVDEHIQELELLAETHHIPTIGRFVTVMRNFSAKTYLSSGKLEELHKKLQELGATVVIFDDEITPGQQRNLETFLKIPVMDRTEIILGVFHDRAQSHEAKLQVELAQIQYVYPRLRRMWTHLSRQRGGGGGASGGGYLKGEGEKQIEIDRRILKEKISQLQKELQDVAKHRETQRQQRITGNTPIFAIVGYTNAGKSTFLNSMTNAGVYVEDKLFATLDTTIRKCTIDENEDVLLVDTVGFIRKLPHTLVAAFKSTLEETVTAEYLIHLIDATNPVAVDQAETTLSVLKELGCVDKPIITVLNKVDAAQDKTIIYELKIKYPKAITISAKTREGIDTLIGVIKECIASRKKRFFLSVPQRDYEIVSKAHALGKVIHQEYEDDNVLLEVELPVTNIGPFLPYLQQD